MRRPGVSLIVLLLLFFGGSLAVSETAGRIVPCPRTMDPLELDGSLADPIWRSIPPLTGFTIVANGPAGAQTEVRACYDDTTLYLIATCREPDVAKIVAKVKGLDRDVRADDCIEFTIGTKSGRLYQVMASAGGGLYDAWIDPGGWTDKSWRSNAKTAVQVFKKAWGVEVFIPLKAMEIKPVPGTEVTLHVLRCRRQTSEISTLVPAPRKTPVPPTSTVTLKFEGLPKWLDPVAEVRTRAGIRYSAADIRNARENIRRFGWARSIAASTVNRADKLLEKPLDYYLSFMPPTGATFAYGFAGCPKCRSAWPRFGARMCSFDSPGKVKCVKCGAVFPDEDPKGPHHDPGDGVVIDGIRYYFKGIWHAWVINQYKGMLTILSRAYVLTGEERYAERAALIFDGMATLAPSTIGPRDNMRPHQKVVGRFHYYTQQWTEHLRSYLLSYDLLYHSGAMARTSPTAQGCTVRQNIEKNLFLDTWDVEMNTRNGRLPTLHNHTSATARAMMGVGLVCGEPDLIRWGIEASYKFIENTIDPEGQYYETSGHGYNECGRKCNASFADMLWNYDPKNYKDSSRFPQPKDYPYDIKLYRHPRMKLHLDKALYAMDCAGHRPRYGDSGPDVRVITDPIGEWRSLRFMWAYALYRTAKTDAKRRRYLEEMLAACAGNLDRQLSRSPDSLFWYRPLADPPAYYPSETFNLEHSSLWGFRATSILRQTSGANRMALILLGGTIFPHGNDDTLGISLYGQGQLLTHEVAYNLFGRHVHYGWGTRSIAHCTVTVDERGRPPMFRGGPNATVTGFADDGDMSFVAMSAGPQCWADRPEIKTYARACAVVALPNGSGYFVDRFEVQGGKQHDYSFHGQVTDKGEGFTLDGASPTPVENAWTLAGLSGHADATFDAPGKSWGERVLPGNRVRNLNIPGEKVGHFGWTPPPGNGYGFIYDVRSGRAGKKVTADWVTDKEHDIHLRLNLFPGSDSTAITGKAPDLFGRQVIPFVIVRRTGEDVKSSFLGVMEGYREKPVVASVAEAKPLDGMRGVVVNAGGGVTDRVWLSVDGRSALVRAMGDKVTGLALYQTPEVRHGGAMLRLACSALSGRIQSVDRAGHAFATDIQMPNPSAFLGRTLFVSSPDYNHNTAYRIESCEASGRFGFGLVGFDLASLDYKDRDKKGVITTSTPMPLAWTPGKPSASGLLDGKPALTPDGKRHGLIKGFVRPAKFELKPGATLRKGDRLVIYDVKEGDTVTIPIAAHMQQRGNGDWELVTMCDVVVALGSRAVSYRDRSGKWVRAERKGDGFLVAVAELVDGRTVLRVE